jgi:hypothetical protein
MLKGYPKPMIGIINSTPCIYMAIIAMQRHQGNIRKCPCIARSIVSGHTIAHYSSLSLGSARSNHDGTNRSLFWPPYLRHLCNSTHQTFKTSPLNVNGDSPRIAIAAPVFSVFHIVSLTRETTKSGSSTTSTACHSSSTASATATLPPTPCDCITEAFLTNSG